MQWTSDLGTATLEADFAARTARITVVDAAGTAAVCEDLLQDSQMLV